MGQLINLERSISGKQSITIEEYDGWQEPWHQPTPIMQGFVDGEWSGPDSENDLVVNEESSAGAIDGEDSIQDQSNKLGEAVGDEVKEVATRLQDLLVD